MKLRLGTPTRMWALCVGGDVVTDCEGVALHFSSDEVNGGADPEDATIERVLVMVTRPGSGLQPAGLLACYEACRVFVRKCDSGGARSTGSYHAMKDAIAKAEVVVKRRKK